MDRLARFTINHARFSWLLIVAVLIGGLAVYATQPRQEDPEITLRSAQVVTRYPGLSAERMEQLVTRPVEDKIKELAEIDDISSISMTGLSIVTPEVHPRHQNMAPIWTDLRNKMDDLRPHLPEGAQGPFVNDDYGRVAVVTLALTGADYSMAELREVAEDLQDSLSALPLVARVDLHGVQNERIWLEFDAGFMAQLNLTPDAIITALRGQNIVLPGGTVNAAGQSVLIEPSGDFRSVDDIRNLAIDTGDGGLVYLRDLASIRRAYVDPPAAPAFHNNRPAIVLGISMVAASDVVELGRQVMERLGRLQPLLPVGMDLDVVIFQPDLVRASVNAAAGNLLQTAAVVLVVVVLFLGWRTGLIVGTMVPLTMMATLLGMSLWGIELHRISIAAIIVALGLLVDNGVVVAEDIRRRLIFVLAMAGLLLVAGQVFEFVKQRSLGPSERNQFTVYLDLPAEAHISETLAAARTLSAFLSDTARNSEVTDVLAYVGAGGPRFFLALSPNDPQPNKAFFVVNTETSDQIAAVMRRVERFIKRDLPQASGRADILFLGSAALGTVEIRVRGPDADRLRLLGDQIKEAFHSVPGVQAVRSDWENPIFKLRVDVDQERARRAGISSQDIARALSGSFDGEQVTSYREGDRIIPVVVRARLDQRNNLDRLRMVEVLSQSSGVAVPLLQVADFSGHVEASRIRRHNQQRALTIAAKHPQLTATELYDAIGDALASIDVPRGYALELEGEIKAAQESNSRLFAYAPHALFLILLLLVLQFNSLRRPAIILLTIPLVLIGANFGLAAFRAYFDFTAMLGLFSLAGIIINNGIVMIDRIDQARREGQTVDDAVVVAALARARPIVMTTITTIVGLMPLALFGGEFWYGMAIVIMCGLGGGTVLTLGVVPILYSLMFDRRLAVPR